MGDVIVTTQHAVGIVIRLPGTSVEFLHYGTLGRTEVEARKKLKHINYDRRRFQNEPLVPVRVVNVDLTITGDHHAGQQETEAQAPAAPAASDGEHADAGGEDRRQQADPSD